MQVEQRAVPSACLALRSVQKVMYVEAVNKTKSHGQCRCCGKARNIYHVVPFQVVRRHQPEAVILLQAETAMHLLPTAVAINSTGDDPSAKSCSN